MLSPTASIPGSMIHGPVKTIGISLRQKRASTSFWISARGLGPKQPESFNSFSLAVACTNGSASQRPSPNMTLSSPSGPAYRPQSIDCHQEIGYLSEPPSPIGMANPAFCKVEQAVVRSCQVAGTSRLFSAKVDLL